MAIAASMLPEFDHEMKVTRSLLDRVPEDRANWQPHKKSMTMGELAIHLPSLVGWVPAIIGQGELNMNPPGGPPYAPSKFTTSAELLSTFDKAVDAARRALAAAEDAALMVPWSLKTGEHTIFTMPRVAVLRGFIVNHIIHHRGQLSVYLRLNDIPVPDIYGPTADSKR
jgi:uncharacterized damage-inducible protein DinB